MGRFASLRAANTVVSQRTLTLKGLAKPGAPDIELDVRPASKLNPPFWSAAVKAIAADVELVAARRNADALSEQSVVEEAERRMAIQLYPDFVIVGWRHVVEDETGAPIVFSPEICREFLEAIQARTVDGVVVGGGKLDVVIAFCQSPVGWMGGADVAAVAKH